MGYKIFAEDLAAIWSSMKRIMEMPYDDISVMAAFYVHVGRAQAHVPSESIRRESYSAGLQMVATQLRMGHLEAAKEALLEVVINLLKELNNERN